MRKAVVAALCAVVLTGCATFDISTGMSSSLQAGYHSGDLLFTTCDTDWMLSHIPEEIAERCERVTLYLHAAGHPVEIETVPFTMLLEGSFPVLPTRVVMKHLPDVEKADGYYTLNGYSFNVIDSHHLLVTRGCDYTRQQEFFTAKVKRITDRECAEILSAPFSLFAFQPEGFFPLEGLNEKMVAQCDTLFVLFDKSNMDVDVVMESPKSAKTLSRALRSLYVGNLKRRGETFSVFDLKQIFLCEGATVRIVQMPLPEEISNAVL